MQNSKDKQKIMLGKVKEKKNVKEEEIRGGRVGQ